MALRSHMEYSGGSPYSAPSHGDPVATKRPSSLKRQKEQQRLARANSKREARRERKRARDEMNAAPEPAETDGVTGEGVETPAPPEAPETDLP